MSTTVETPTEILPFHVDISQDKLADLHQRIAATRWPHKELVADRSQGVQLATIQELARYWATEHDWPKTEAKLNALPQFKTEIDGVDIHFIHVKSPHADALPLIMTHGWPGSVIELLEVVGPLTDPAARGGRAEDAFELVLPSLPGYGSHSERRNRTALIQRLLFALLPPGSANSRGTRRLACSPRRRGHLNNRGRIAPLPASRLLTEGLTDRRFPPGRRWGEGKRW